MVRGRSGVLPRFLKLEPSDTSVLGSLALCPLDVHTPVCVRSRACFFIFKLSERKVCLYTFPNVRRQPGLFLFDILAINS